MYEDFLFVLMDCGNYVCTGNFFSYPGSRKIGHTSGRSQRMVYYQEPMNELDDYKHYVRKKLEALKPVFARAAQGNYSVNVEIPTENDEFLDLYVGVQVMIETIRKQLDELRALNILRERFVFVAAHELKAPVAAIEWGLASLLGDESFMKILPTEYQDILSAIERKNKNLIALVGDLLRVSRMHDQDQLLDTEAIELSHAFEQVKEVMMPLADQEHVSVSWLIFEKKLPKIQAHEDSLKEILNNLISNAIRYNKAQGSVTIDGEVHEQEIIIHVRDTGIGIDEANIQKLFKEFSRVQTEETKKIEGTGLGLFITKQLVDRMNGRIWVESTRGKGSTFSFALPIAR